jgi:hypothetical protein
MKRTESPLKELPWGDRPEEARQRYLDRVRAVGATRRSQVIFSHTTALAILGLPFLELWPQTVDITEPPSSYRRSKRGVVVHRAVLDESELAEWEGFLVTSASRTIADLARSGNSLATVVALDHALGPRAIGDQAVTKDRVLELVLAQGGWGASRAAELIAFSDPRSGSAGESGSRVLFAELGFAIPELQVRHPAPDGGWYDADFKWRRSTRGRPLIGEFDGAGKYLKAEYLGTKTPGEAVIAEKKREDWLRSYDGSDFMRWGMEAVRNPQLLERLALAHGVPRAPRRPK